MVNAPAPGTWADGVSEAFPNAPLGSGEMIGTATAVPGMTRYHIHVPRSGKVTRLPEEYDTVEEAILAFELDHDDAPWCLVDRRESDKAPPRPYETLGSIQS